MYLESWPTSSKSAHSLKLGHFNFEKKNRNNIYYKNLQKYLKLKCWVFLSNRNASKIKVQFLARKFKLRFFDDYDFKSKYLNDFFQNWNVDYFSVKPQHLLWFFKLTKVFWREIECVKNQNYICRCNFLGSFLAWKFKLRFFFDDFHKKYFSDFFFSKLERWFFFRQIATFVMIFQINQSILTRNRMCQKSKLHL